MSGLVQIYDSTLRDGAQSEGISFSVEDKVMVACRLDALGIHYIEGGWPNPTNMKDLEFFERVRDCEFGSAKVVAFGSTCRVGSFPEDDLILGTLLRAGTDVVTLFGKSWTLHVSDVLRVTLDDNLRIIMDSCGWLKENGREVIYDAEHFFDGYKAGVHVDAMLKESATYEHCRAEMVGNRRRFLLSEQSGGGAIVSRLDHLVPGVDKGDDAVQELLKRVKELEYEGYVFEAAEASFEILARRVLGMLRDPFQLIQYRTINCKNEVGSEVEAVVKIEIDGQIYHTIGEGNGPVNALDLALRGALESVYPTLKDVRLEDYKVRVLSSAEGTAAKTRVLIESSDRKNVWNTVGVSENSIEASWIALVDSMTYKLLLDGFLAIGD